MANCLEIYGENWFGAASDITVSSGASLKTLLCDQDAATRWHSSGSSDSVTETIRCVFRNKQGVYCNREFDRIILLGTNVKNLSVYYAVSGGAEQLLASVSGNAQQNLVIEAQPAATAAQAAVYLNSTQSPHQEKHVGELKLCKKLLTLNNALADFERKDIAREGHYYLCGGQLVRWKEYCKRAGTLTLSNLSKTDRDTLRAALENHDFLTFALYKDFDMSEIYEFAAVSRPQESFNRKTALYSLALEVTER